MFTRKKSKDPVPFQDVMRSDEPKGTEAKNANKYRLRTACE